MEERERRRKEGVREGFPGLRGERLRMGGEERDLSGVPMVREVREILEGKWDGKPHWALD